MAPILDANQEGRGITPAQVNRLYAIASACWVTSAEVGELLEQLGVTEPRDLTRQQYDDLIATIEAMDPPTDNQATDPQTGEAYEPEDQ